MDERRLKKLSVCPVVLTGLISLDTTKWDYDIICSGMPSDARIVDCYFNHNSDTCIFIVHSKSFPVTDLMYDSLEPFDVMHTRKNWE